MKAFDHFTCSGKIAKLSNGRANRSIGGGDNMCYFESESAVGRQILTSCPVDSDCQVVGVVNNDMDAEDWSPIITRLYDVRRRATEPAAK